MTDIFKVGDNDYSEYVVQGGVELRPVEVGVKKVVTMDGITRKSRAAIKRQVTVTMELVPDPVYRRLEQDVRPIYFPVTFSAAGGAVTATCFTDTGAIAVIKAELGGVMHWETVQVTVTEQ